MSRWLTKQLGELCVIEGGNAAPQDDTYFQGGTTPFVRMKDLGRYHFTRSLTQTDDKLTDAALREQGIKVFEPGCILFPRSGSVALNHRAILGVRAAIVSHIGIIKVASPEIRVDFLYWFLTAFDMSALSNKTTGVDSVAFAEVKRIEIPLPPLSEQERIVRILDEAEALRRLRTQADERTSVSIVAVFAEMFLGGPSANWRKGPLAEFGVAVRYGLGQPPESDPDGVALVRATNVKRGRIVSEGLIRVDRSKVPSSRNAFLRYGEVIVVRSGAYTGDIGLVDDKWEGAVAGYDMVLSPSAEMDGTFLTWLLMSKPIQEGYFAGEKARAGQPHLNAAQVEQTPAFAPPITLQRKFASRVAEIRELEAAQVASRQRLDDLFQSLLHRAFQGAL